MNRDSQQSLLQLNQAAVSLSSQIKLLSTLAWSPDLESDFLKAWSKGQPRVPRPVYNKLDFSEQRKQLHSLSQSVSESSAEALFTKKSIDSYIDAIDIVDAIETDRFTAVCAKVYGRPDETIPGSRLTAATAASLLLEITEKFDSSHLNEPAHCVSGETIQKDLELKISNVFGNEGPEVIVDSKLSAKAAASSRRVRLREGTCFTAYDADQLFAHEVLTHSLTSLNGQAQPFLTVLGRGAPRTTKTQEGLATFSELITGSMDIFRLKRLALRVKAIDHALSGGNFVDIFKFFLDSGYCESESFWSTARIFRGGIIDAKQPGVFTKDIVYLEGLIKVSAFFRWALTTGNMEMANLLFCGRMTLDDVFLLKSSIQGGTLSAPKILPDWFQRKEGFAGTLAFSFLSNAFHLDDFESLLHEYNPS